MLLAEKQWIARAIFLSFWAVCFLGQPAEAASFVFAEQPDASAIAYFYENGGLFAQCHSIEQEFTPRRSGTITSITLSYSTTWIGQQDYPIVSIYGADNALLGQGQTTDTGGGYFNTLGTWTFPGIHATSGVPYYWKMDWCDHGLYFGFNYPSEVRGAGPGMPYFVVEGEPVREPIIIVPGVMGSRLNRVSDGEEVWPNVEEMSTPFNDGDAYLDELILDSNGLEIAGSEMFPSVVIDDETVLGFDAVFYGNLLDSYINEGYLSNTTLFDNPYDWRLGIKKELDKFDEKIQRALANSPTGKINIIAHSMGGLLAKEYLTSTTSTDVVSKLVLVGVPQLGAPKTFKALAYGDNIGFKLGPIDILNPERVKIISQNMPAIYELLPSRRYIEIYGGYIKDFREGARILNYDETGQLMTSDPDDSRNPTLLDVADEFHQALDSKAIEGLQVYNIVGCQNPETIGAFRIYPEGRYDIDSANGDGTVPLISAMNLANNFENYFIRHDQTGIDHMGLVKDNRILELISRIINDEPQTLPYGIATSTTHCFETPEEPAENETTIMISTHSPVALHVYDSENRHTGPLPNGDIELGISTSSYERIGENSFAFVPGGTTYRIVADANARGNFDLKTKRFAGSTILDAVTYVNIPILGDETRAELLFTKPEGDLTLHVDSDGNGVFDIAVEPTGVLSGPESSDVHPPHITIISPQAKDYSRSEFLASNIEVIDSESGIAFENVSFDDRMTNGTGTLDLFFERLGGHELRVRAADKAGNYAVKEVGFRIVATPESTIADIERASSLGWIEKESIKNNLVRKLERAIKIEKRIEILEEKLPGKPKIMRRIERLGKKIDKILAKDFVKELETHYAKGHITEEGYVLLKEDVEWLVNQ